LENLNGIVLGVDGRIILKWSLKKEDVRMWNGFNWLRIWSTVFYRN
jgi:hypothetical protein